MRRYTILTTVLMVMALASTLSACIGIDRLSADGPSAQDLTMTGFNRALMMACRHKDLSAGWRRVCQKRLGQDLNEKSAQEAFIRQNFNETLITPRGGLITGYYIPQINVALTRTERFRYPILGVPQDLIHGAGQQRFRKIPLTLEHRDQRIEPYPTSATIRERTEQAIRYPNIATHPALSEAILAWAENPIDVMNAQLQGSATVRVLVDNLGQTQNQPHEGALIYAEHNGQPFRSVTASLLQRGLIRPDQASVQALRDWAKSAPEIAWQALDDNPRTIFFRWVANKEGAGGQDTIVGAQQLPLTGEHSVAVDPAFIPMGTLVRVRFNHPLRGDTERLALAQDKGSAITGPARLDFFWGFGEEAGRLASQTKAPVGLWRYEPKE